MNDLTFEARIAADHLVHLPDELPVGMLVRIHVEPLSANRRTSQEGYRPRTEIGRLALAARQAYLEAGGTLLSVEEIGEEVRRRRGGVSDG